MSPLLYRKSRFYPITHSYFHSLLATRPGLGLLMSVDIGEERSPGGMRMTHSAIPGDSFVLLQGQASRQSRPARDVPQPRLHFLQCVGHI